jgi:hypothetical protein
MYRARCLICLFLIRDEANRRLQGPAHKARKRAGSMADVFHSQRYTLVEDAIPMDTISNSSDHIYAEIEHFDIDDDTPPLVPPRADTPTLAPNYPPYSSTEALRKKSRQKRINIDKIPRFYSD